MYKYLIIGFLALAGCNKVNKSYVCINPFMSLQGIVIDTTNSEVKDNGNNFELPLSNGDSLLLPKSFCAEIKKGS